MPELKYLGHIINYQGTKPDPSYVKRVLNLKKPENKEEIERFKGIINC